MDRIDVRIGCGVSIRSVAVRTLEEKRFDQAVGTESDR